MQNMKTIFSGVFALGWWWSFAGLAAGIVTYEPESRIIRVQSFPEITPATLDVLAAADKSNGWGVVLYDQSTDTYKVNASLYIGDTNDLGTYVQIGRKGHSHETVIVKGDVWIKPPQKSLKKSDDSGFAIANRLTIGDPADANIQAVLKIDCSRPAEYGVLLGSRLPGRDAVRGGDLYVYNSTITAATPNKQHIAAGNKKIGAETPAWAYAADIILVNARISWLTQAGGLQYRSNDEKLNNTVFEHVDMVLANGGQRARNCVFRGCGVVLAEGGCLTALAIECVFTNNDHNWTIGGKGCLGRGVTLIDCQVGLQKQTVKIQKYDVPRETALKYRINNLYPACTDYITLPVKVTDRRGSPLPLAAVSVACPEDKEAVAVRNGYALTDAQGLTPADPESAILIARRRVQATDDPTHPKTLSYVYVLAVQAPGCQPYQGLINPGQDLPRPLVIKLEKTGGIGCGGCRQAGPGK